MHDVDEQTLAEVQAAMRRYVEQQVDAMLFGARVQPPVVPNPYALEPYPRLFAAYTPATWQWKGCWFPSVI